MQRPRHLAKRRLADLPTREFAVMVRQLRRDGKTHSAIYHAHGSPSTVAAICQDLDSGGHDYDPVDDQVAINRVVNDLCADTFRRLSVWEQHLALAAIYQQGPDLPAAARERFALAVGFVDLAGLMRLARASHGWAAESGAA